MRRGNQIEIVRISDQKVSAVSLGSASTAEHEWGIKRLKEHFGIAQELTRFNAGLQYRRVTCAPEQRYQYGNKLYCQDFTLKLRDPKTRRLKGVKTSGLLFYHDINDTSQVDKYIGTPPGEMTPYSQENLYCGAWSGEDFGLMVPREERDVVTDLLSALQNQDACIWLGGGGVFRNAGLCIGIVSRMPDETFETWKKIDNEALDLEDAVDKTGVLKRLADAGIRYHACSPRWKLTSTKDGVVETVHPVMFFLNPYGQDINNYGWFTVEQLDQWIDGTGPIPKK